jgi:hypothetical protein
VTDKSSRIQFAFDRSARRYDVDGRLHVVMSNISKAAVNPYYGREIPKCEELRLDPNKVYYLLRDPEELERAAPTFNNLPLLSKHVPVSALDDESHQPDFVVGSLGTDAEWRDPYLRNSLVVWAAGAIAGIESRDQQELSAAYRYDADMTPGTHEGLHFDGVMRNIRGNHVALVESGRAGSDVVVGDSQIEGLAMLTSRTALMLSGALAAAITPRLAQDAQIDFGRLVQGVNRKNYAKTTKDLPARVLRAVTPKLAADGSLDVDDVVGIIGALSGAVPAAEPDAMPAIDDDGGDVVGRICSMLEGKVDDETMAAIRAMGGTAADGYDAEGEHPEPDGDEPLPPKKEDKPAMDAALRKVRADAAADFRAVRDAEREVFPYVGEVVAMDSAADVYGFALETMNVDLAGVPKSAYRAVLKALPVPGSDRPRIAQDAAPAADFGARFPTAHALKRAI